MTRSEVEEVVSDAVGNAITATLLKFGIEEEDRKEIRADLQHLRKWRKSVEGAQSLTFKAIIATLVSGFLGLVWMGVKTFLGK